MQKKQREKVWLAKEAKRKSCESLLWLAVFVLNS
jgi:hypothetical protein